MKKYKVAVCLLALFLAVVLAACGNTASGTILEMELTKNYDTSDPFIHEKLIYVTENTDTLPLDISFQMQGESGILEIADNETKQVVWSDAWNGNVDENSFPVTLTNLQEEKEYVVRFTGTGIEHTKMVITSESSLVKEREKPSRPDKN